MKQMKLKFTGVTRMAKEHIYNAAYDIVSLIRKGKEQTKEFKNPVNLSQKVCTKRSAPFPTTAAVIFFSMCLMTER
jgi:hypothetical protein